MSTQSVPHVGADRVGQRALCDPA
eukprot:COSAG01_NODE_16475_length_1233_cov_3.303351_1_plen_23_part_01